jgi:hypothetical protein
MVRDFKYVLDGGSLLQRIPWTHGDSFGSLAQMYVDHVIKKYKDPFQQNDKRQIFRNKAVTALVYMCKLTLIRIINETCTYKTCNNILVISCDIQSNERYYFQYEH